MKQTNIQIRGQKSSQFLKKHFYCIPLPLGSKPHKIDHFELRMGQITHSFLAMVIGEIKFTTPLEKKKKSCGECATPFRQQVAYVSWMNDSWMNNVVDIE